MRITPSIIIVAGPIDKRSFRITVFLRCTLPRGVSILGIHRLVHTKYNFYIYYREHTTKCRSLIHATISVAYAELFMNVKITVQNHFIMADVCYVSHKTPNYLLILTIAK
jgi:hypothetical protein